MPIFRVYIPLTGFAGYDVEADNADDAIEAILEGDGVYDSRHSEYCEDIDSNNWDVYQI